MNSVDCRDRTAEFFSTIQQIQKTQQALQQNGTGGSFTNGGAFHPINDGTSHRPLPKSSFASSASYHNEFDDRPSVDERTSMLMPSTQPKQQSQFTQAAQHIGRNIHMVTEKLEKLGKLAKQRSLFNDPANEINELTFVIKNDLSTLHNELEVLHKWVISHRDGRANDQDTLSLHAARNSTAIVDNLKQQLMSTTKNFQEVLQVRTNNLKEQNSRRKQFEAGTSGGNSSSTSTSSSSSSALGNGTVRKRGGNPFDQLMNQAASQKQSLLNGTVEDNEPIDDFHTNDAAIQDQLMAVPIQGDDYLTSRAQAVENIESTIVELGEMYKRLVHIVGMQEEITLRIDANMDQTLENMDKGHSQLLTYYDSISGSRWLILKVFAVLLAFLIFFMIFVA